MSLADLRPRTYARLRSAAASAAHAFLIKGSRGAGLPAVARELAAMLLCEQGGCGSCGFCASVAADACFDLSRIGGGSPVPIAELRELLKWSTLAPASARRRVVIVEEVERLRTSFPVLLKSVEEPPPATSWIFTASTIPRELLPIASRCFPIDVDAPGGAELAAAMESAGLEPTAELKALVKGRLDRVELLARLGDPIAYFSQFRELPSLVRPEAGWLMELARRLDPESGGITGEGAREILRCGLEILAGTAVDWAFRASRAASGLDRNLSVRLVLAELLFRADSGG